MVTTRQWLRRPETVDQPRAVELERSTPRLDPDLPALTLQERQAILALARATHEPDPLSRVYALWEAIEFYTSGVSVPPLFGRKERKAIKRALPDTLSSQQRERALSLIGELNNAPLRIRLRAAMDADDIPIDDGEVELLWRLRDLRNDVVHGRKTELPAAEDVEYATSIVARMVVHRLAQRRGATRTASSG